MSSISIKKNALLNIIRTLLSIVFPLITFPYATRVLQPEGIGRVQFAAGVISYFVMFAGLGIGTYGIRETAKRRDNYHELSKVTKELFFMNLIPMFIAYVLFVVALFAVPKFCEYRNLLIVYSATILFTTLGMEWLYSGLEQYVYITIRQIFFQLCSLVLLFLFVKQKEDVVKYAAISVFANVGSNICNFIHSRKCIDWHSKDKIEIFKHLKPVFILFGMRIAASLYVSLNTVFLGFLSVDTEVGYYEAANKMTRIIVSLITCVTAVLLPRLSFYVQKKDINSFNKLLMQSFDILILFAFPMAAGLFILRKNIILIISGALFLPAVSVMGILSALVLIIPLSGFLGNQIFLPLGKEKVSLYTMISGAGINIILSSILIRKYGALGAAIASLAAETCITVIYFIIAFYNGLFSVSYSSVIHSFIATILMVIVVFFVNQISINLMPKTVLSIIVGIFIYVIILYILHDKTFMDLCAQIKNRFLKRAE